MRNLTILLVHLISTLARLLGPRGLRSVVAESVLIKHQFQILNRSRQRSPNLRASDRILVGICVLLMRPSRMICSAIVLKPSTILDFRRILRKRKYRTGGRCRIGQIEADMKTAKEEVKELLEQLPETASLEDIQYHIYVRQKIQMGLDAETEGRVISQAEVEQRMARWLEK